MGSSSDTNMTLQTIGIIPRMIKNLFEQVKRRETSDPNSTYKIQVQFLEIYGEDIRDLLDQTKSSNVTIRETREDGVFVAGAREELVSSYEQMMKALEDGTKHRTTASTRMNQTSSRSHGKQPSIYFFFPAKLTEKYMVSNIRSMLSNFYGNSRAHHLRWERGGVDPRRRRPRSRALRHSPRSASKQVPFRGSGWQ